MPGKDKITLYLNAVIEASALITLFCLPFSKSIVEIFVTLAIAAFLIKKFFIEKSLKVSVSKGVLAGFIFFTVFSIVSMANSQYFSLSIRAIFSKVFEWVLLFLAVSDTVHSPKQAKRFFMTMLFSAGLILADAAYQHYVSGFDFLHYPEPYPEFKFAGVRQEGVTTFPTASFPFPNDFAAWIIVFLPAFFTAAFLNLRNEAKKRAVTFILTAFLAFFLFLTTSRAAIAGAVVAVSPLILIKMKKLILPLGAAFVLALIVISFVPGLKIYATDPINPGGLKASMADRFGMWSTGWRIFMRHPFTGNGVNTFFENFKNYRTDGHRHKSGSYAHNCYLQMASDIGIFGLLSFLFAVGLCLYKNIKRALVDPRAFPNSLVLGLSLGVIAFLIHSFFDTNLYSLNLSALFWLSLGFIEGIS